MNTLADLGLRVSFSKNVEELTSFESSSIKSRVEDIHESFLDPSVDGILTTLGGFNSNQLLSYLDFEIIKNNPKVLCGFSDITALSAAIYQKTGLVTYSGPHFSTFSVLTGAEYTIEYFTKCLMETATYDVSPSPFWSDGQRYSGKGNLQLIENTGWKVIQEGFAEGILIGGNLCTLNLLQGTEFFPNISDDIILFVEDDYLSIPEMFDRDLQSLLHVSEIKNNLKGVVIGRFQEKSNMTLESLTEIIQTKKELVNIPVIADVNFGHVLPIFTFPFGGKVSFKSVSDSPKISILQH